MAPEVAVLDGPVHIRVPTRGVGTTRANTSERVFEEAHGSRHRRRRRCMLTNTRGQTQGDMSQPRCACAQCVMQACTCTV